MPARQDELIAGTGPTGADFATSTDDLRKLFRTDAVGAEALGNTVGQRLEDLVNAKRAREGEFSSIRSKFGPGQQGPARFQGQPFESPFQFYPAFTSSFGDGTVLGQKKAIGRAVGLFRAANDQLTHRENQIDALTQQVGQGSNEFRQKIQGQVDANTLDRFDQLDEEVNTILRDVKQRQAGRGTSESTRKDLLLGDANRLGGESRSDISDQAVSTVNKQIDQRSTFGNTAVNNLTQGFASFGDAGKGFQNDLNQAQQAFENSLNAASTADQKNAAFQAFEKGRADATLRFTNKHSDLEKLGLFTRESDNDNSAAGQIL